MRENRSSATICNALTEAVFFRERLAMGGKSVRRSAIRGARMPDIAKGGCGDVLDVYKVQDNAWDKVRDAMMN